jgi:hypothetical protein
MRRSARLMLTALLTLTPGCSGWVRLPEGPPKQAPEFKQFQVWSRGKLLTLHSMRAEQDTLRGIPVDQPRACEDCRVSLAMADVDSVMVAGGRSEHAFTMVGLLVGLAAIIAILGGLDFANWLAQASPAGHSMARSTSSVNEPGSKGSVTV